MELEDENELEKQSDRQLNFVEETPDQVSLQKPSLQDASIRE